MNFENQRSTKNGLPPNGWWTRRFNKNRRSKEPSNQSKKEDDHNVQDQTLQSPPRSWRMVGDHPKDQIIGSTTDGVRTKMSFQDNMAMISQMEPKTINEAIVDDSWIEAMKEELSQFERNKLSIICKCIMKLRGSFLSS